ncbi:MAG TPA: RNA methyltransferase [Terriglobales bacterium]|jgi:TrmH family RNA methyltransferase|nr:RNA methyltransferase [Terriglobales bacterium]
MTEATHPRLRRVSSAQNALVKELRRAGTRGEPTREGYCAIESPHIVDEAIRSGLRFQAVFLSESAMKGAGAKLLPQIGAHTEVVVLPDAVFDGAVATESPQGIAALVKLKDFKLDDLLRAPEPLLAAACGIQDPGNLGTLLRSAEAFEASGVLLGEKTVGRANPKVVRASAGSLFRLPLVEVKLEEAADTLSGRGLRLVATSSHRGTPLDQAKLTGALALFIGSEGAGIPRELLKKMDEVVAIPHSPKVESLNAGVAASILLYEAARQRNRNAE